MREYQVTVTGAMGDEGTYAVRADSEAGARQAVAAQHGWELNGTEASEGNDIVAELHATPTERATTGQALAARVQRILDVQHTGMVATPNPGSSFGGIVVEMGNTSAYVQHRAEQWEAIHDEAWSYSETEAFATLDAALAYAMCGGEDAEDVAYVVTDDYDTPAHTCTYVDGGSMGPVCETCGLMPPEPEDFAYAMCGGEDTDHECLGSDECARCMTLSPETLTEMAYETGWTHGYDAADVPEGLTFDTLAETQAWERGMDAGKRDRKADDAARTARES